MHHRRSKLALRAAVTAVLASAALAAGVAAHAGPAAPDLVITAFGLKSWGSSCKPGAIVYTFQVTVKNQGTGTWPVSQEPAVTVSDLHPGVGDSWGVGASVNSPLAPGHSATLLIQVPYYSAHPSHMWTAAPHPFQATVNRNHAIVESNYANNIAPAPAVWNGQRVIMMGAPAGCPKK
jgi:hypothetical protein